MRLAIQRISAFYDSAICGPKAKASRCANNSRNSALFSACPDLCAAYAPISGCPARYRSPIASSILCLTNSSSYRNPSLFRIRYSSSTITLSMLPPRARPSARIFSTSCTKPKVRARNFPDIRCMGEIHFKLLARPVDGGMRKINGEFEPETKVGFQPRAFITVAHFNPLFNLDELFERVLLFNARQLQQKHKGAGAAVHNRHFFGSKLNLKIVNAQSRACRHQMFDGRDAHALLAQYRSKPCIAHILRGGCNINGRV